MINDIRIYKEYRNGNDIISIDINGEPLKCAWTQLAVDELHFQFGHMDPVCKKIIDLVVSEFKLKYKLEKIDAINIKKITDAVEKFHGNDYKS
jgi:hypothetical protein